MKTFILNLKYWQRGFLFGVILFLVLFGSDLFFLLRSYTGACGDMLTHGAKMYPCSLLDYILNDPFYGLYTGVNARLTWVTYASVIVASSFSVALYGRIRKKWSNIFPF